MYEEIKHLKINEIDRIRLNAWVESEIVSLANDYDSKLDDVTLAHTCKRFRDVLVYQYGEWEAGTIHAVLQNGLSGVYGKFVKVNVQSLMIWLKAAQNQHISNMGLKSERENKDFQFSPVADTIESRFIIWATVNRISLHDLDPNHDPISTKQVSPVIIEKSKEFHQYEIERRLDVFKKLLKLELENE